MPLDLLHMDQGSQFLNLLKILRCWNLNLSQIQRMSAHYLWDQQSCGASSSKQPKLFTQDELNDLSRDLNLSKESAQLLGSRLRDHNLLAPGTTFYW